MTQTAKEKDFNLDHLLHPAGAFRTPMEVVNDPDMTVQEKRAILASWASDACAVEASPELRERSPTTVVRFDEIMEALKRLDGEAANRPDYGRFINRAQRWKDLYRANERGRQLFAKDSRQPGMRRALDEMKAIEQERPGLVGNASLAAGELAKRHGGDGGDGGRMPE
jgi:hypothetical protein